MSEGETTLGRFNQVDFQPEKHLGMWAQASADNLEIFKRSLSDVEVDGFHLINRILILDVPIADVKSPDWEIKAKPITDKLHKIAKMISSKGEVKITTALVGERERPMIAEFFSVKPISETDHVLMMTFVQLARGFLPKNYRQIPVYSSIDSGAFAPRFIGEVAG
ncbi:hypothetical protein HZB78_02640 [Candidatus Collierbacteria bacterium]|nr:hypothetical protein [Candidatus Collierbacteria bacterium]